MKTLGIRNNNPLNIRHSATNKWHGEVLPTSINREKSLNCSYFCKFSSLDYGLRAGIIILRNYIKVHNLCYLRQIIQRYAPSFENDCEAYIYFVRSYGVPENKPIIYKSNDFLLLVVAMCYYESNYKTTTFHISNIITKFKL